MSVHLGESFGESRSKPINREVENEFFPEGKRTTVGIEVVNPQEAFELMRSLHKNSTVAGCIVHHIDIEDNLNLNKAKEEAIRNLMEFHRQKMEEILNARFVVDVKDIDRRLTEAFGV